MVRVGMNPARGRSTGYRPARVTVAVLVYLPHLSGYFEHRFDVVKLCLATLRKHTEAPYDLLVFDNGSCAEVKAYLQELLAHGEINYLLSSAENIGKPGALRLICHAAPGEVIAYTDDDTFFYPGWLSAHLELLDGFPNVGLVSGCAERTLFSYAVESNLRLAETDPEVGITYGKFIPEEWEAQWAVSLGRDPERYLEIVRQLDDIVLERRGVKAYATACHNQFVTPKRVITRFLDGGWSGQLMGGMKDLELRLDEAGYLHLSTIERTTRLIGNLVSPEMGEEARRFGIEAVAHSAALRTTRANWLLRFRPIRWFLQGVYNRLFWLLSGGRESVPSIPEARLVAEPQEARPEDG